MSIPTRQLGKTGLEVSILGFGGGHFARKHISVEQSVSLVQRAIDAGLTFMDNAWEYHDGESERRMGLAIEDRREKVVLMTNVKHGTVTADAPDRLVFPANLVPSSPYPHGIGRGVLEKRIRPGN